MFDKFADELKSIRISQNLTLQQVAVKTRIDYKFLESMERGDFEFLPELYVKSFLKEYLRILGLDEQIYIKKYEAAKKGIDSIEPVTEAPETIESALPESEEMPSAPPIISQFDAVRNYRQKGEESSAKRKRKQLAYYVIAGVIAFAGIVYLFFYRGNDEIVVPEKPWDEIVEDTRERYIEGSGIDSHSGNSGNAVSDSLSLTIKAIDTTWIKIVLDNSRTEEFILFPGSQKSMKTGNEYKIIIGNSAGVNLDLNGKPLNFKIQSGPVQRIQIDSSGVKSLQEEITG